MEYLDAAGQRQEVRCQEVVLAAGSYASPGLLLRSGVGPRRELHLGAWGPLGGALRSDHGVETLLDLPGVGKNLKDHLYVCVPLSGIGSTLSDLESETQGEGFQRFLETGKGLASTSLPLGWMGLESRVCRLHRTRAIGGLITAIMVFYGFKKHFEVEHGPKTEEDHLLMLRSPLAPRGISGCNQPLAGTRPARFTAAAYIPLRARRMAAQCKLFGADLACTYAYIFYLKLINNSYNCRDIVRGTLRIPVYAFLFPVSLSILRVAIEVRSPFAPPVRRRSSSRRTSG